MHFNVWIIHHNLVLPGVGSAVIGHGPVKRKLIDAGWYIERPITVEGDARRQIANVSTRDGFVTERYGEEVRQRNSRLLTNKVISILIQCQTRGPGTST